jgi:integrase/recombinase XerC
MENKLEEYKDYLIARNHSISYYNVMKVFYKYLSEKKLEFSAVTQDTLTDFFNTNNYSARSKNLYINAGRNYGDYLQILKEQNEFYKIKLLKVESKTPNYLTEKDIEEAKKYLIVNFSRRMTPAKIRAVIDFMFYSGCRKEELLTLKRSGFDLAENVAKLYGKGDKERIICYPEKVKKEIEAYFLSENEENNAFNLTNAKISYVMRLLKKYLGKNVYCHLLRHSFARNLIYNRGVDINTVSKLLGHSNLTTTMIYVNPDEKALKDNYKKLVG